MVQILMEMDMVIFTLILLITFIFIFIIILIIIKIKIKIGTHCAGTAAGHKFGVAKEANLIAVRVLNNLGTGSTSGIIEGINW